MQTCLASKGLQKPQPQHLSASFPNGYNKHVLETVDSTNAEAARIAGSLSSPTWILGLKQTAGRGRGGRHWADPQGNFAATLVLFPDDPLQTRVLRSFVAAVALFDTLVTLTGRAEAFSLKWPNDVLLNGAKLAGILLETVPLSAGRSALAIGMGDRILMKQYSTYSVISPEGCASILWKSSEAASEAANAMHITADDLLKLGVIDGVIKEPLGGSHRNVEESSKNLKESINSALADLRSIDKRELIGKRRKRFSTIGEFIET